MKKRKISLWIILSLFLSFLLLGTYAIISGNIKYKKYMNLSENELVAKIIKNKFILGTSLSEEELLKHTPIEMISLLNDKYSDFLTAEELESSVNDLNDSYVGLGFEASKRVGEVLEILNIMTNSPSYFAGLKQGDKILKIDGKPTKDMGRTESLALIRGKEDSTVELTIERMGSEIFDIDIVRKKIENKEIDYKMITDDIGYIYISQFPLKISDVFLEYLNNLKLKGMKKLIIDLRGNTGGEIQEIIPIASGLLNNSIEHIFTVKRKDDDNDKYMRTGEEIFSGPLVILCNESTASAAELLISVLKDYGRCRTIGEKTFGKQISQEFFYMDSGNILKLSTGLLISPKENIFNKKGIVPDIVVPMDFKEDRDIQLEKAISILQ